MDAVAMMIGLLFWAMLGWFTLTVAVPWLRGALSGP